MFDIQAMVQRTNQESNTVGIQNLTLEKNWKPDILKTGFQILKNRFFNVWFSDPIQKSDHFRGACNLSKKKTRCQCNKAHGFCIGTAIGFLVAASKTEYIKKKNDEPLRYLCLYLNNR